MKKALHIISTSLLTVALVILPILSHPELFAREGSVDAVSSASVDLPDQPSGDFYVLINTSLHKDSFEDWEDFFNDGEFVVIFEDISCLTAEGDVNGIQLAERFQAQLPENQMKLRQEDPTLMVSKAENGYIDVAVISAEMAEAMKLDISIPGVTAIKISGGV